MPPRGSESTPPPNVPVPISADFANSSLLDYWRSRLQQVVLETYCGVPMLKFAEDLRVYEHILWSLRIDTVVEIGTFCGGSALWFRDRLRVLADRSRIDRAAVVTLDIDQTASRGFLAGASGLDGIVQLEMDILDPAVSDAIASHLAPNARVLLVEDGAHTYDTTLAALEACAPLVSYDGFVVVEDGVVDIEELRVDERWPTGVQRAIEDWLARAGTDFERAPEWQLYGVTTNPNGYLRREPRPVS